MSMNIIQREKEKVENNNDYPIEKEKKLFRYWNYSVYGLLHQCLGKLKPRTNSHQSQLLNQVLITWAIRKLSPFF